MAISLNFCPHCGSKLPDKGEIFCPECGKKLDVLQQPQPITRAQELPQTQVFTSTAELPTQQVLPNADLGAQARQGFNSIVEHVNQMTGGTGKVDLNLKDLIIRV